jgi:hypothetical protein
MVFAGVESTMTGVVVMVVFAGVESTMTGVVVNVTRATQGSARTQLCPRGYFGQVRKGRRR